MNPSFYFCGFLGVFLRIIVHSTVGGKEKGRGRTRGRRRGRAEGDWDKKVKKRARNLVKNLVYCWIKTKSFFFELFAPQYRSPPFYVLIFCFCPESDFTQRTGVRARSNRKRNKDKKALLFQRTLQTFQIIGNAHQERQKKSKKEAPLNRAKLRRDREHG